MNSKHLTVAANQFDLLVGGNSTQCVPAFAGDDEPRVDRVFCDILVLQNLSVIEVTHLVGVESQVGKPGPARVDRHVVAVLLGAHTERGHLHTHRQVLRNDRYIETLICQVESHREDARIIVTELKANRQHRLVNVV